MSEEDHEALAALPAQFTIYQGHTDKRDDGWSWTVNRETAEWFARRFASMEHAKPKMTYGYVNKVDVVAHLLGRSEHEIIINPDSVYGKVTRAVRKLK